MLGIRVGTFLLPPVVNVDSSGRQLFNAGDVTVPRLPRAKPSQFKPDGDNPLLFDVSPCVCLCLQ